MDVASFLDRLRSRPYYDEQIRHTEVLPERAGQFADPSRPLPAELRRVLRARGIERLYTHQVDVLEAARRDRDVVVVTGTASGKTLCYHLPVLERAAADPEARALYLFPTKALAQDQLKGLLELVAEGPLQDRIRPGVYDGDTPTGQRRRIRSEANLVLSNPDMLHASILPYHPKWARFFQHLRFVVLDEVHSYRGILGANVACVLRRLQRVCGHYDAQPVFLATSATIANPGELVGRLIGRDVEVVQRDGSPRGRKIFALWNPSAPRDDRLARQSAHNDAVEIMVEAVAEGAQTLVFGRTRQATELVYRYATKRLDELGSPAAKQIRAYRGGYLPAERREIEQALFSGRLRGVAATNALELGIDVGSLDVTVLAGYPGTISSTWQQAGRSGRRREESLAVLIAGNDPVDQYLLRHPDYFFAQTPEHAVVDPENPYVLAKHLRIAAFELPLSAEDIARFGAAALSIVEVLEQEGQLTEVAGGFYFAGGTNPAVGVSLRHMSDNTFSIVLRKPAGRSAGPRAGGRRSPPAADDHEVIANVDAISAPELVYPEAVYLHDGESYLVRELDLAGKVAYVERRETDYYTQAVLESNVKIVEKYEQTSAVPRARVEYGKVDVSWMTVAFKKIQFETRENIGMGPVDIPAQNLLTTGFWLAPDENARRQLKSAGLRPAEAVVGLRNLAIVSLPIVAMCDSRDLGGVVDSKNFGQTALILYDRYPGGLGYCERAVHSITDLLGICQEMVAGCPCTDGCPSCVGLPNLRPAIHSDPDLTRGYPIPNKQSTIRLLEVLTAAGPVAVG